MNYALTLRPPAPHRSVSRRLGLVLMLSIGLSLASASSLAPTLIRSAAEDHARVCKCAHCSGGLTCCCRFIGRCPLP